MKAVLTLGVPDPVLSAVEDRRGPEPEEVASRVLKAGMLRTMQRGTVKYLRVGAGLVMVVASVLVFTGGELRRVITVRAEAPVSVEDQMGNAAPRNGFALVLEDGNWVRLKGDWNIYDGRDPRRERRPNRRWDPRRQTGRLHS